MLHLHLHTELYIRINENCNHLDPSLCIGHKVVIESPIGLSFIYKHRVLPFSKTKQILWFVPQITAAYEGQFFSIIICLFLKTADGALCKQLCFLKSGYFDGNMSGIFMVCFPSMILRTTSFVETQCIQWGGDSVPQFLLDHPGMTPGSVPNGWPSQTRRDFDKPTDFYPFVWDFPSIMLTDWGVQCSKDSIGLPLRHNEAKHFDTLIIRLLQMYQYVSAQCNDVLEILESLDTLASLWTSGQR